MLLRDVRPEFRQVVSGFLGEAALIHQNRSIPAGDWPIPYQIGCRVRRGDGQPAAEPVQTRHRAEFLLLRLLVAAGDGRGGRDKRGVSCEDEADRADWDELLSAGELPGCIISNILADAVYVPIIAVLGKRHLNKREVLRAVSAGG